MYKSISSKNLTAFVAKMWESGIEVCLKPESKEISIYSGPKKYETIKVTTESEVDDLVAYVLGDGCEDKSKDE